MSTKPLFLSRQWNPQCKDVLYSLTLTFSYSLLKIRWTWSHLGACLGINLPIQKDILEILNYSCTQCQLKAESPWGAERRQLLCLLITLCESLQSTFFFSAEEPSRICICYFYFSERAFKLCYSQVIFVLVKACILKLIIFFEAKWDW